MEGSISSNLGYRSFASSTNSLCSGRTCLLLKNVLHKSAFEHQLAIFTNGLFIRNPPLVYNVHGEFPVYSHYLMPFPVLSGNGYEFPWTPSQIRPAPPTYQSSQNRNSVLTDVDHLF